MAEVIISGIITHLRRTINDVNKVTREITAATGFPAGLCLLSETHALARGFYRYCM